MGENSIYNKLIVMDDISGLADQSNNFANFLTVSRKFNFTCVYVFHTIYSTKSNWQVIFLQTKIFNIFPGSLQTSSVVKILSLYCNRYAYEYIQHRDLWLNRLYFEKSNSTEKKCLTIDMRHVNSLGPSKFRAGAKNDKQQICNYNYNKKDMMFNRFLAIRKQTSTGEIIFSIVNLIDKSNKTKNIYYNIGNELNEFDNDRVQFKHRIRELNQSDINSGRHEATTAATKHNAKQRTRRISSKPRFLSK